MTDPIRWGILGASNFALKTMVPALHQARGSQVVALASRSPEKARPFSDVLPDLRVEESYDGLLAAPDIDAIYVPLPNHLHVDWTVKALEAGKHVLCEKPMAMEAPDFDRLIAARDTAGRLAAEGFMIVHHPQWRMARDILAEGRLGELGHVEVAFSFNNPDPGNIRNRPGMGGGGLRDIGVYAFGCVRFATGKESQEVTARLRMEHDFDTVADVTAQFPGFSCHAFVSTRMAARQRVVFHGSAGWMELTAPFNAGTYDQAELTLETEMNARVTHRFPTVNQYVLQAEAFHDSVRHGTAYPWPLERARGTQAMIDAAFASGT